MAREPSADHQLNCEKIDVYIDIYPLASSQRAILLFLNNQNNGIYARWVDISPTKEIREYEIGLQSSARLYN